MSARKCGAAGLHQVQRRQLPFRQQEDLLRQLCLTCAPARGPDFLTLCFLLLHARPLWGADLRLLCALGYAIPDDKERLYVRVTDRGLSIELGIRRQTIAASVRRLARRGLVDVHPLPPGFGGWKGQPFWDSKGRYMGTKLYLMSRELEGVFYVTYEDC